MRKTIGVLLVVFSLSTPAFALETTAPPRHDHPVTYAKRALRMSFAGFTENAPYIKVKCRHHGYERYICKARYIGDRLNALVIVKERFTDDVVWITFHHLTLYS